MSETAEKQAEPTTDVAERRWRLTGAWASGFPCAPSARERLLARGENSV